MEDKGEKIVKFKKKIEDLRVVFFAKSSEGEAKKEVLISIVDPKTNDSEKKEDVYKENRPISEEDRLLSKKSKFIYLIPIAILLALGVWWLSNQSSKSSYDIKTIQETERKDLKNDLKQNTNVETKKYLPKNIENGLDKIKKYYSSFKNESQLSSTIQSYYNPMVMDYHGRKYVTSLEAKDRDLHDFTINNIKSYRIEVSENDLRYNEFEYYYLYNTNLNYKIIKNNGEIIQQVFPINIALTKDEYKILGISRELDPTKIDELITEEVEVNIDDRLYYEKGIKDPNIIAIRNLIDDYNTKDFNKNVQLDGDIGSMMSKFNENYFKSKFMLLAIEDAKYGGKWATILFIDKPDRGFFVWLYDGRIKGFGDAKLTDELLSIVQSDLDSFDKRYGF